MARRASFGGRFGMLSRAAGGGSSLAVTPPVLSLAVAGNVYPPELDVALDDTVLEGDTVALEWYSDYPLATLVGSASNTIDAGEAAANAATFTGLSSISSPAVNFFRARVERGGGASAWSNVVKHGDVTAPTITSSASQSAVSFSLTADEYVTWSIIGGADAALWEVTGSTLSLIDQTGVSQGSHTVQVQAEDLGGNSATQTITVTLDVTPAAFSFTDVTDATTATEYTSNTITVSGLGSGFTVPVTITGGTYSKNGGAYTSAAGEVVNGDTIAVRQTSSAIAGTQTDAVLTINSVSDTYSVTTAVTYLLDLDASDLSTLFQSTSGGTPVASDGDPVGTWNDKSGRAFHLSAVADTNRPTYDLTGGVHSVVFDGIDNYLRRTAALGIWSAGAATVAMALKKGSATNQVLFAESNSGDSDPFYQLKSDPTTATSAQFSIRDDVTSAFATTTKTSMFDSNYVVLILTDSGSEIIIYDDNVAGTPVAYSRSGHTLTLNIFEIGALIRTTVSNYANFELQAMRVYNRVITSGERAALTTAFGALQGRTL